MLKGTNMLGNGLKRSGMPVPLDRRFIKPLQRTETRFK